MNQRSATVPPIHLRRSLRHTHSTPIAAVLLFAFVQLLLLLFQVLSLTCEGQQTPVRPIGERELR